MTTIDRTAAKVAAALSELELLPRRELELKWQTTFGGGPPKGVKQRFLQRGLAHRAQVKIVGGLKAGTKRRLTAALSTSVDAQQQPTSPALAPGARLVREWNGNSYTVDVLENGFRFEGARYRSLSAIARIITGAQWSGPRFFGL